ncbi:MAG: NAD(P)H-dependent oxidoreductase [Acidimicrobiales bacterium]
MLAADGLILGTPANLGTMSGALKHFFDTIYYPCLTETVGRPYGVYVHGNNDVDGALADIAKIATGLQWRLAQQPVRVFDRPGRPDLDACWEVGAAMAAGLMAI